MSQMVGQMPREVYILHVDQYLVGRGMEKMWDGNAEGPLQ